MSETFETPTSVEQPRAAAVEYAGFWKRFVAYIIDGILLSAVSWSINFSLTEHVHLSFMPGIVVAWLYFALMESSNKQATLGKNGRWVSS